MQAHRPKLHYIWSQDAGTSLPSCIAIEQKYRRNISAYLSRLTQFPKHWWYTSLHNFKLLTGSTALSAESRHWTYFSRHRVWQSKPCASACQKRPKLREIRIAPVIFLLIDFYLLLKRHWIVCPSRCRQGHQLRFEYRLEVARIAAANWHALRI